MHFARTLKGFINIRYGLRVITGLLIRMPVHAQTYRIGGADQYPMVTRRVYILNGKLHEVEVPYIPGSSVKGRMRSLLELSNGFKLYSTDQKIWQHTRNLSAMGVKEFANDVTNRCIIDDLFGYPAVNYKQIYDEFFKIFKEKEGESKAKEKAQKETNKVFSLLTVTRLLFSDLFPEEKYVNEIYRDKGIISIADFLEEKSENRIDRVTAAADPRDIVRVKPEVRFEGSLTMLIFDIDKDVMNIYLDTLVKGFKLMEMTYLGGSGSRGYGRVKFRDFNVEVVKLPELKTVYSASYGNVDEFADNVEKIVEEISKHIFK